MQESVNRYRKEEIEELLNRYVFEHKPTGLVTFVEIHFLPHQIHRVTFVDINRDAGDVESNVTVLFFVKSKNERHAAATAPHTDTQTIICGNVFGFHDRLYLVGGAAGDRYRLNVVEHANKMPLVAQNYLNFTVILNAIVTMEIFLDLVKILVPASVLLYAVYLTVRTFIQKEIDLKKLEIRGRSIETVLPNRLQAYERMTLFLERIAPQNLLIRLNVAPMPARDFHQLLLNEIRNEYNHNVSQQVYMSEEVWEMIKNAKEDLVVTINDCAATLETEASSLDLSKKIFEKTIGKELDPIAHALSELKREIQRTF